MAFSRNAERLNMHEESNGWKSQEQRGRRRRGLGGGGVKEWRREKEKMSTHDTGQRRAK